MRTCCPLLSLLLAGTTACSGKSASETGASLFGTDPAAWSVTEPGPYRTGHRTELVTYTTPLGDSRQVAVNLWYPTEETSGEEVRYDTLFVDPDSLGGAVPIEPIHAGGYPVLVHSHGHWGVAGGVRFLAQRLASHGWVTVAPEHAGNTFSDGFPAFEGDSPTVHYIDRPTDMAAVLDALAASEWLRGPIQADAVGLSGHSRGAYTGWTSAGASFDPDALAAACAGENTAFPTGSCTEEEAAVFLSGDLADDRFAATILLDGTIRRELFGAGGHRTAFTPFLALSQDHEGHAEQFDSIDALDFTWLPVEGACHETFNLGIEAATGAPCDTFDVDRGWDLTATYSFAFLRHHLLADHSPETLGILDGSIEVDPAVAFHHKSP